jgi:DNA-binding NtrC family response regulator
MAEPFFRCLVIEDDRDFASMEASVVRDAGGDVTVVHSLTAARGELARGRFDLVILDNRLPDGTGHAFCPHLLARMPEALVIMITGVPELAQAVALTRNGLFDYLAKPVELTALRDALERVRLRLSQPDPADEGGGDLMIGKAPAFLEAVERMRRVARHREAIVLILGETGTGKDVAARQLHAWTRSAEGGDGPFVPLNCSAVPAEMFEAELFGAERGAYTGADRRRSGVVEAAGQGTLFLDEIGDVPLSQQTKFLRFLESREYRPLGGTETRHFSGRIVAATNRDLAEEVRKGRFRQDLLYRLDVLRVEFPPLRERRDDIPLLTAHLLGQLSRKYGRRCPEVKVSDAEELLRHTFPGNIRELRNVLERSLLHTPEQDHWLALDRSWLSGGAEGSDSAGRAGVLAEGTSMVRALEGGSPTDLTPVELQEFELYKRVLIEERGAIRRTAARLGVSHQVVLRRLHRWPQLRELARSRETPV